MENKANVKWVDAKELYLMDSEVSTTNDTTIYYNPALSFGEAVDRIERMGTNNKTIWVTSNSIYFEKDDDLLSEEEIQKLKDEWV